MSAIVANDPRGTLTLPAEVAERAAALRAAFGPGVKLKFWADNDGNSQGNPALDDVQAELDSRPINRRKA